MRARGRSARRPRISARIHERSARQPRRPERAVMGVADAGGGGPCRRRARLDQRPHRLPPAPRRGAGARRAARSPAADRIGAPGRARPPSRRQAPSSVKTCSPRRCSAAPITAGWSTVAVSNSTTPARSRARAAWRRGRARSAVHGRPRSARPPRRRGPETDVDLAAGGCLPRRTIRGGAWAAGRAAAPSSAASSSFGGIAVS